MTTEFLLALFQNLKGLAFFTSLAGVFIIVILLATYFDNGDDWKKHWSKKIFITTLLCGLICVVPDVDDLWRIRISLIKLELSSKENIQKASETIERIGTKLECKYLGCEEKKK